MFFRFSKILTFFPFKFCFVNTNTQWWQPNSNVNFVRNRMEQQQITFCKIFLSLYSNSFSSFLNPLYLFVFLVWFVLIISSDKQTEFLSLLNQKNLSIVCSCLCSSVFRDVKLRFFIRTFFIFDEKRKEKTNIYPQYPNHHHGCSKVYGWIFFSFV